MDYFVAGRVDKTMVSMPNDSGDGLMLKNCLQFFQDSFYYDVDDEEEDKSIIFPMSTDTEKIVFANWLIEQRLGDFCQCDTYVFISEMYVPANGQILSVPVAEVVT